MYSSKRSFREKIAILDKVKTLLPKYHQLLSNGKSLNKFPKSNERTTILKEENIYCTCNCQFKQNTWSKTS